MTTYYIYTEEDFTPVKHQPSYSSFWGNFDNKPTLADVFAKDIRKAKRVRRPKLEVESIDINYTLTW